MSSASSTLIHTPLTRWHVDNAGRMVDFAGWLMPVQYQSVIAEHHHTRNAVGLFDVSHMGRFFFYGSNVGQWLDGLMTRRVACTASGKIRYSLMTNQAGGILDDVLVYHMAASGPFLPSAVGGNSFYMVVVNAGNRDKLAAWFQASIPEGSDIILNDRTETSAMIAVQGPQANHIVAAISTEDPAELGYYAGAVCDVDGHPAIVSRTGYTGEDGCEIIVDAQSALPVWEKLAAASQDVGGGATGLAARDTLRLEAGMPLYGNELSEEINAAATNLRFAINLKDRNFCGADAIAKELKAKKARVRVGIELAGRRPARQGCPIMVGDQEIGHLTSGTLSPTLQKPIAMGYVEPQHSAVGTAIEIDIRGKRQPASVVDLPFYQRAPS